MKPLLIKSNLRMKKRVMKGRAAKCPHCSRFLCTKERMIDHVNAVHLKRKLYKCTQCELSFGYKSNLQSHAKRVHLKSFKRPFSCSTCQEKFETRHHMQCHINTKHLKLKMFKCNVCAKSFGWKQSLTDHINVFHKDEMEFECNQCSRNFKTRAQLKRHVDIIHLKKEGTKCARKCKCCFRLRELLAEKKMNLHVNQEQQENFLPLNQEQEKYQFQCELCQFSSSKRIGLRIHTRRNHPDVPMSQHVEEVYNNANGHDINTFNSESNDEESTDESQPNVCSMMTSSEPEPISNTNKIQLPSLRFSYSEFVKQNACVYECQICKVSCSDASSLLKHWRSHAVLIPEPAAVKLRR